MKRIVVSIFLVLITLLLPTTVLAQQFASNQNTNLSRSEVVNSDYFAAGETVTISGTVNGDVYAAGGTVIIDGIINGDILATGGNVTINGAVSDDVRVAGGNVTISGTIGKNLTIGTGNGTITSDARINGSVVGGAGNLTILAPIGKNAVIGGGTLVLGNIIRGNVTAGGGNISLANGTNIQGNFTYTSDKELTKQDGASISGTITRHELPKEMRQDPEKVAKTFATGKIMWEIYTFITTGIIGLLFLFFFPVFTVQTATVIKEKTLKSLGTGFLLILVMPVAALLFMITIVGIPFSFLLMVGLLAYLFFAKIFIAYSIGEKVFALQKTEKTRPTNVYLLFFVGLLLYKIITLIPVFGGLFAIVATLIGMGALASQKMTTYHLLRKRNEI